MKRSILQREGPEESAVRRVECPLRVLALRSYDSYKVSFKVLSFIDLFKFG